MLKTQRGIGLLLAAGGAALEALTFSPAWLEAGPPGLAVAGRCAAVFGAALYALTMTGRRADALVALLPVPVLAPVAAVLLSWRRGDLARPAPRRLVEVGECLSLALGTALLGWGMAAHWPAGLGPRPAIAYEAPPPAPVAAPAAPAERESAGSVHYQVWFVSDGTVLTTESERVLSRVADTLLYYPLDDLYLRAEAPAGDVGATALALSRLEAVRSALAARGVRRERTRTGVAEGTRQGGVDVYIVGN